MGSINWFPEPGSNGPYHFIVKRAGFQDYKVNGFRTKKEASEALKRFLRLHPTGNLGSKSKGEVLKKPKGYIVYLLENNDRIVMGIFQTKAKAEKMARDIGQIRWHEAWKVTPYELDLMDPGMMGGCECYGRMVRKLEERKKNERG